MNEIKQDRPIVIPSFKSLIDLLKFRSIQLGDNKVFTFLLDGESKEVNLSFENLDQKARSIAAVLQKICKIGDRALLLYPPGIEYITAFFGCIYAGVIAVTAYPPRLHRTLARLRHIAQDSAPKIALTTVQLQSRVDALFAQVPELREIRTLTTDEISISKSFEWIEPECSVQSRAFIQYTSGTTSLPKGVVVTHGNLLHNSSLIMRYFETNSDTIAVSWLPPYHDMGLIGGIIQPVFCGFRCVILPPVAFLQSPIRWLKAISNYRATLSGGPNMAYEVCLNKITPEQRESLDLSSWELACCGSDAIEPDTMKRFYDTYKPYGFRWKSIYPCYGLAEATLIVSGQSKNSFPVMESMSYESLKKNHISQGMNTEGRNKEVISCGRILPDIKVRIVDSETLCSCSENHVGEIWVSSLSNAEGYWNRTDLTKSAFQAFTSDTHEGPFLRTGDIGVIKKGELFFMGRLNDRIMLNDSIFYPQDIERAATKCHPFLRPDACAVFTVEIEGEDKLIIAAELERRQVDARHQLSPEIVANTDYHEVIHSMRNVVLEQFELETFGVCLLKVGSILKTSSGKIQRFACRDSLIEGKLDCVTKWLKHPGKCLSKKTAKTNWEEETAFT